MLYKGFLGIMSFLVIIAGLSFTVELAYAQYSMTGINEGSFDVEAFDRGDRYEVIITCRWQGQMPLTTIWLYMEGRREPFSWGDELVIVGPSVPSFVINKDRLESRGGGRIFKVGVSVRHRLSREVFTKYALIDAGAEGLDSDRDVLMQNCSDIVTERIVETNFERIQWIEIEDIKYPSGAVARKAGRLAISNGTRAGWKGGTSYITFADIRKIIQYKNVPTFSRSLVSAIGTQVGSNSSMTRLFCRIGSEAKVIEALKSLAISFGARLEDE